jgi:hypothetical protein
MKPLCTTFAMAGFLLSSALAAQAHVSACALCQVPVARGQVDLKGACGGSTPDFQAAFLIPSGPNAVIQGEGCNGQFQQSRGGPPPNVALCCARVNPALQ